MSQKPSLINYDIMVGKKKWMYEYHKEKWYESDTFGFISVILLVFLFMILMYPAIWR